MLGNGEGEKSITTENCQKKKNGALPLTDSPKRDKNPDLEKEDIPPSKARRGRSGRPGGKGLHSATGVPTKMILHKTRRINVYQVGQGPSTPEQGKKECKIRGRRKGKGRWEGRTCLCSVWPGRRGRSS